MTMFFYHVFNHNLMNKISYLTIFVVAFSVVILTGLLSGPFMNPLNSVHAVTNQSDLQPVDFHLEECIKQLQSNNTEGALNHCQLADQQLDTLLGNTTK
jgi:hypothetical protein